MRLDARRNTHGAWEYSFAGRERWAHLDEMLRILDGYGIHAHPAARLLESARIRAAAQEAGE
jgi:hypothetical protein